MKVTRQTVADELSAYLHRRKTLDELVGWAERQMMDSEFDSDAVRDAVARLGVADVRAFGLTWDDCQQLLSELGFTAEVQIVAV